MSGDATFSGTDYQGKIIAYVAVHVLTETKLRWLTAPDDTPIAVSGEVEGPGDDVRIEFNPGLASIEVQAKHGFRGQKNVEEVLKRVRAGSTESNDASVVVLAVDTSSSPAIRSDLRTDTERLRSGRNDALHEITRKLLKNDPTAEPLLRRIRVLTIDLDGGGEEGAKTAIEILSENLEDSSQAEAAWAVLRGVANEMCAKKLRHTRAGLIELLASSGIRMLPRRKTRRWHDDLRISKTLLADENPTAALAVLNQVEAQTKNGTPDAELLYRLNQHKAAAYIQLQKFDVAATFAARALDHNPTGLHALANLANAKALLGETALAQATVTRTLQHHPQSATAWVVAGQVASLAGATLPTPPSAVADSPEYRRGLAQISLFLGEASQGRDISAALIRDGDRSSDTLILRIDALLADIDDVGVEERLERAHEIDRFATEITDGPGHSNASIRRALVGRSVARRLLGRHAEAQADVDHAREMSPDDPAVLGRSVQAMIQGGDDGGALALLNRPIVDDTPDLLAMRAVLAVDRDREAARRDLDAVVIALADPHASDQTRSTATEAAIKLGDIPLARRLLSEVSEGFKVSPHAVLMQGRIAFIEGDLNRAEENYRHAAAELPSHQSDILIELALKLIDAKNFNAAKAVLRNISSVPAHLKRSYARALIAVDELAEAQKVIDGLVVEGGILPDWAVGIAAQIATRRNDVTAAANYLEELVARDHATIAGTLTLVETLLDLGHRDRANVHLDKLLASDEHEPIERMQLAQLLCRVNRGDEAIDAALQAFREAPHSPDINRAFAGTILNTKKAPAECDEVLPDTHVLLRDDAGGQIEYLLFSKPAFHRLPNEVDLESARAVGLLGLRVGDVLRQNAETWHEKQWKVVEIQPVAKVLFNDVLAHYNTRFPDAPFFVTGFKVNADQPSIADLQPMIVSTRDRDQRNQELLTIYREKVLPLDFVARMTGGSVSELMSHLSQADSGLPLYVEWSDEEGTRVSAEAANGDGAVVLTRSALFTLQTSGLLNAIKDRTLLAPRSLRDVLQAELAEAEERVDEGWHSVVAGGPAGITFQNLPPWNEVLRGRRDSLKALLDWCEKTLDFQPRPLEAFGKSDSQTEEGRQQLGESASDALELAQYTPATLYADDLGLRRLAAALQIRSFSTISLLHRLTERGMLSPTERDRHLVDLAERHYNSVIATPELLREALGLHRSSHARRETFSLLAGASMTPVLAARTVLRAVKIELTSSIQSASIIQIVREGLSAMVLSFPLQMYTQVMTRVAEDELILLPNELQLVKKVCVAFLKEHLSVQI